MTQQQTPQVKRQKAYLEARSKELDERETLIASREDKLADIEASIKLLGLKHKQSTDKLTATNSAVFVAEQNVAALTTELSEIEHRIGMASKQFDGQKNNHLDQITTLKQSSVAVSTEIKERKNYLKSQETLIEEKLQEGNDELTNLNYEIKQVYLRKDKELEDLAGFEETRELVTADITKLGKQLTDLQALYNKTAASLKQQLADTKSELDAAQANHKKVLADGNELVKRLSAKEKELNTREEVLGEKEAKLVNEARSLESKRRLYASL